ncbi:MAG: diguanylate cyclase [Actinomycetia bacterium]|nr:diguanylate cyclase [Actinomycetes bacterium]MCH9710754.1 diguanylate cyclase [Actinomycetes bacterium]MCH9767508.1 diguanylate cyclase [Actinomycetes bacterium]
MAQTGSPGPGETLRRVAQLLKSQLREQDSLFRYGGAEIAVVLPAATNET